MAPQHHWQRGEELARFGNRWLQLIGERWRDGQGQEVNYWRVEKAHSAITVVRQGTDLILPPPQYRPGIDQATWDFAGGRWPAAETPAQAIARILRRELGLQSFQGYRPINEEGWWINSSFSNQQLFGFLVDLGPTQAIAQKYLGLRWAITEVDQLLPRLRCLQCRALLETLWRSGEFSSPIDP